MSPVRIILCLAAALLLAACSTSPPKHTVSRARSGPSAPVTASPPRPDGSTYTVARGDTLYSIAFRNQLDYHDLASWNGIGRDYAIRIGQSLRLTPPGQTVLPPDRSDTASAAPMIAIPASPPTPAPRAAIPASNPIAAAGGSPANTSTSAKASAANMSTTSPVPAAAALSRRTDSGSWEWPTRGKVVRHFGEDPSAKGLDITGDRGQIVVASRGGKVVYSGTALKGYGELIIVKHDEQYLSAYGYNRKRLVEEGDTVVAGQPIAELGDGPEQRPLLHFEIREKGRPVDPSLLLPKRN